MAADSAVDQLPEALHGLVNAFRTGSHSALARAISLVEDEEPGFQLLLHAVLSRAVPPAHRIGVTGPPGAGKSSLVSALARLLRDRDERVGVLAVDPTSPFTGGAVLGDRIRMNDLATDPGIFIRSMASRGSLGGLATASKEALDLMDAFGFSRLFIETVGVGQAELEVAAAADTIVVVLVPESGDAIQAMKAGLMEIADLFVVNKADRPGADRLAREIREAVGMKRREGARTASAEKERWTPPVLLTTAHKGEGVEELLETLERHRVHLRTSGELEGRRRRRAANRVRDVLDRELKSRVRGLLSEGRLEDAVADRILEGSATAYAIADELLGRVHPGGGGSPEGALPESEAEAGAEAPPDTEHIRAGLTDWEAEAARVPQREASFSTVSGMEVPPLQTPLDRLEAPPYMEALGFPGRFPFTRGPYATMYRTRLWTMRQFAGFGSAEETNLRYKYLLEHGQTGLSVAFDFPTLMGYDSDHPRAEGEVGLCGVAISCLADMEALFDGIPLDQVSVSMTINGPALILFCFFVVAAERQGVSSERLQGTIQNDILKEFQAQHAWIFPPEPALRTIVDMFDWCARNAPRYNPISISGYHIREAGATAAQELAFTLGNGFEYVRRAVAAGLDVDAFAPRLSFFFDVHNDFFEEVAKLRAARRIWARHMKEVHGARNPESWRLRTHAQTAGVTLTAQQAENNIARVAYQAMAAVLGGTQSLHTNSMDETLALPTERAVRIALRTQQILAYETGVADTIDPLAGSYHLESLTDRFETEAERIFREVDALGGVVPCIESGWFQREIAASAARQQREVESGARVVVGVNRFQEGSEGIQIETLRVEPGVEARQRERLGRVRAGRDEGRSERALAALDSAARSEKNLVPAVLECVRADCTLFEIRRAMEEVFGSYREPVFF